MQDAWIVEIAEADKRIGRGLFHFSQLPACGDRVSIPNDRGTLDILGVIQVEYAPVPAEPLSNAMPRTEPVATIYVQWVEEDDGQ
ncbi:MAG: hypothetical protein IT563_01625 [Alphaproteobacteria bacterium]|nr:hypothetical protein [Alphaproteobacteria bacterium]